MGPVGPWGLGGSPRVRRRYYPLLRPLGTAPLAPWDLGYLVFGSLAPKRNPDVSWECFAGLGGWRHAARAALIQAPRPAESGGCGTQSDSFPLRVYNSLAFMATPGVAALPLGGPAPYHLLRDGTHSVLSWACPHRLLPSRRANPIVTLSFWLPLGVAAPPLWWPRPLTSPRQPSWPSLSLDCDGTQPDRHSVGGGTQPAPR